MKRKNNIKLMFLIVKLLIIPYAIFIRINTTDPTRLPNSYILILAIFIIDFLQSVFYEYKVSIENNTRIRSEKLVSRGNIITSLIIIIIVLAYEVIHF